MPSRPADLRRDYRLHLQIGAATALLLVLGAFTVPMVPENEQIEVVDVGDGPIDLLPPPPTNQTPPPPPPPPAPPPPVEVEDDRVIEDLPIPELTMDFEAAVAAPRPPAPPAPPPVPQPLSTEPPPLPADDPAAATDEPFVFVQQEPVLIDGLEGLQRRVVYPEMARTVGVQGTVYVQSVVERDGSVSGATAVRSPNDLLSEAALTAVRASQFEPGHQRGIPVRVRYTLPVRFVLR
ncbi:MAG: energy transducer TonB [Bacteroidota bacterium]